jgi:16S rRNA (uracil1498-N3)-methyltransferase
VHPRSCTFEILTKRFTAPDAYHIHLAIAPTKNADRMEWMVEKCVEVGLHELTFLSCDHSERSKIRFDRLKKKAISAMKQSRRAYALSLHEEIVPFRKFVTESIADTPAALAHVSEDQPHMPLTEWHPGSSTVILIGPEGDFSTQELALATSHEIPLVSLGKNRLRTETAGLIATHTMLLHYQ